MFGRRRGPGGGRGNRRKNCGCLGFGLGEKGRGRNRQAGRSRGLSGVRCGGGGTEGAIGESGFFRGRRSAARVAWGVGLGVGQAPVRARAPEGPKSGEPVAPPTAQEPLRPGPARRASTRPDDERSSPLPPLLLPLPSHLCLQPLPVSSPNNQLNQTPLPVRQSTCLLGVSRLFLSKDRFWKAPRPGGEFCSVVVNLLGWAGLVSWLWGRRGARRGRRGGHSVDRNQPQNAYSPLPLPSRLGNQRVRQLSPPRPISQIQLTNCLIGSSPVCTVCLSDPA